MFDKKKLFMVNKLTIAIIILIILLAIFPIVYSKFVSKTDGSSKVGTAFYILKSDYFEANIELGKIVPRDEVYIYPFTVSNNDGKNRLETKMQYDLKIVTTTNLPLTYALYMNEDYNNNIITEDRVITDDDGTYFKEMTTNSQFFGFTEDETNKYELYVYFPSSYDDFEYQDIIEAVNVVITSKQVLDGE